MSCWSYSRCSACSGEKRQVMPDGPTNARIALVGEGPGKWEDYHGMPFVGRSGQEQDNTYFKLAGLDRSDVFITNAVQCRQERNNIDTKPSDSLLWTCAQNHLYEEILTVNPEIVIFAGASACQLINGPAVDLEMEHGFPRRGRIKGLSGWEGTIVPMYHPAAGMHRTTLMTPLLEDWGRLGKWLRGEWEPPTPEQIKPQYTLIRKNILQVMAEPHEFYDYLPVDTESNEGRPYSIQFSTAPGKGYFCLVEDKEVIEDFAVLSNDLYDGFVLHNATYDLDELDQLGIRPNSFRDTMQELYHLGNLPQGLKAAVYRIFGHRMTSYDEVVTPWSKRVLEDWLAEALGYACAELAGIIPHPIGPDCPTCGKTHRKDVSKPHPHESEATLRRIINKLGEGTDYDPWQPPKMEKGEWKARLLGREWLQTIEEATSRMPRKSIVHAPLEQQVQYGCSDADFTGRLATWLEGERERIVQEEWSV